MELACAVRVVSPTVARLPPLDSTQLLTLKANLEYTDEKVNYEYKKHKNNTYFINRYGYEAWNNRLQELKAQIKKSLLFEDDQGHWVYSGLARKVAGLLGCSYHVLVQYPEAEGWQFKWNKQPPYKPFPFQTDSKEALIESLHAGVEIGTGLGKSFIIELLIKHYGLKTVVMCPSLDIAKKFYEECLEFFGPKKVGFFGDGKKVTNKLITIGISASLTRVEPGTPAWKDLSAAQVFIADESHQCPAATLVKVCFGLMAGAPYRFFMSATQMRGDGLDLVLDAITGPIVYRKTVREGIDEGYLAKLQFMMINTSTDSSYEDGDPNEMTRVHLFYNDRVLRLAASIANQSVAAGCQVLILIEELEQFTKLFPYLTASVKFAHGGVSKENRDKLAAEFHDSDPTLFVKQFNDEQFKILVGTSCITTGTDIKANEVTINLCGGKSEIQVMQGPSGRSTRLFTFKDGRKKTQCTVIDFDVVNNEVTHRHSLVRRQIYDATYGTTQTVSYGN